MPVPTWWRGVAVRTLPTGRRATHCWRSRWGSCRQRMVACFYFVDAESSSVRSLVVEQPGACRPTGEVRTIVGTGLFEFGDRDGDSETTRLQHSQGITVHSSGRVMVADSYNDAVKWVDPVTRTSETYLRGFREPGGLAYHAGRELLYVADTMRTALRWWMSGRGW